MEDIFTKIIPFFSKYYLIGNKNKDFQDFIKVAHVMKNGLHLIPEGLGAMKYASKKKNKILSE